MKPLAERLRERKLISRGDISSAFRARDTQLDRDVFLKILHPHFAEDPDLRTRFEREAKAAARLDHPQLVRIYEVGEDPDEGPFMILEWIEGETLRAKIEREGKLTPEAVAGLAHSLLTGLGVLHEAGILHRDIKPENILRRTDGQFKLTDFSLALLSDAPKLTHHSAVVGTPAYLAPELARGKAPSERSDLFAVGVVLFESATGINPFYDPALLESLRRVREEEPDWSLLEILSQNPALTQLIKSCLEKESEDRPTSASSALALLQGSAPVERITPRSNTRHKFFFTAAALLALLVAIIVWPRSEPPVTQPVVQSPVVKDTTITPPQTKTIADSLPVKSSGVATPKETNTPTEIKTPDTTTRKQLDKIPEQVVSSSDSFELFLDTTPWAHVTLAGVDLGTTPLGKSLKLPAGKHAFMLRNPAYPPIQATIDLNTDTRTQLSLTNYVQHLEITAEPWGEIYLDNEHIGTSPLNRLVAVLPGPHQLRITHPNLPALEKNWTAVVGDTLSLHANLQTSKLATRTTGAGN